MNDLIKKIIMALPIKMLIGFILDQLKKLAEKTETNWDNKAIEGIEILLDATSFSNGIIHLPPKTFGFLKAFDLKDIIETLLNRLSELAKKTDTPFDDYLVSVLREIFQTLGLVD